MLFHHKTSGKPLAYLPSYCIAFLGVNHSSFSKPLGCMQTPVLLQMSILVGVCTDQMQESSFRVLLKIVEDPNKNSCKRS